MGTIKITREVDWLLLEFDYDWDFIDAVKAIAPPEQRDYDPDTKLWRLDTDFVDDVLELAPKYFHSAVYEYRDDEGYMRWINLRTGDERVVSNERG